LDHYLRGLGVSTWGWNAQGDTAVAGKLKTTRFVSRFWPSIGLTFHGMMIYAPLISLLFLLLMCWLGASLAKTYQWRGERKELKKMKLDRDSGTNLNEPFATLNHEGCWSKTSKDSLPHMPSELFSDRWPNWGTMHNGVCYRQKTWVPRTCENESSSVHRWPTPRASEYKDCGPVGSKSHQHMDQRSYLCAKAKDPSQPKGMLSAEWVDLLMGFPKNWTQLGE